MFDKKEIEFYRSISAPENLRERVLSSWEEKQPVSLIFPHMFPMAWSVAACLVLVIVLFVFQTKNLGEVSIWVSGNAILPESSTSVYPEHGVTTLRHSETEETISPSIAFPMKFMLPEETEISVSSGEMEMTIHDTVSFGTILTAHNEILIIWHINPTDAEHTFVMNLQGDSKSETLTLVYDETTDIWTISRNDKH